MKYLKYFTNESDYQTFKGSEDYVLPNVSYVVEGDKVKYNLEDFIIMTSESNPEVMKVCYNQGWAASPYEMYASEAAKVTSIGTAFQNLGQRSSNNYGYNSGYSGYDSVYSGSSSSFTFSFDEFKYFTGVTSIEDWAFASSNMVSITIPDSVTSIGEWAFNACSRLTGELVIPDSVTTIGSFAFFQCSQLTEVTIGTGVTSIGDYAFSNCYSLTEITIPDSVTSIGNSAFYECSLTEITIPDSVTSIGDWAFDDCSALTSIICLAPTAPSIQSNTFQNIAYNGTLKVPVGSDYSSWMSTTSNYLGFYNWTVQEI
mgnify:CR=1 FL=1